jgi:hypothetical protein
MVDRHPYIPRIVTKKLKGTKLWKFRPIQAISYNNPKWPQHQETLLRYFSRQCRTERISLFRWFPIRFRRHLHHLRSNPSPNPNPDLQERAPSYDPPQDNANGSSSQTESRQQA